MKKYMTKVLSSHFDVGELNIQDQFKHKSSDVDNVDVCDGVINGVLPQNLREMRHRQQLKQNKGVILKCSKCSKVWDTESTINGVINYLLPIH
jgi:serine/threonine-protein kinase RIO1